MKIRAIKICKEMASRVMQPAMETSDSFGYWVRRRRKALDLTQEELARRVGCAVVTLRKIEADERRPSRQMAARLAENLALSAEEAPIFLSVAAGEQQPARLKLPPRTYENKITAKLPVPANLLVGRTAEMAAITHCLRRKDVRLHTLTGPVGVGKTRLAIEAGLSVYNEFRDGVCLVDLASLQDPALVPSATASALGVKEARSLGLAQSVAEYLARKEILLIFDNFEHLQSAADFLSMLLASAPGLRLLVTSRACLHLYGEHEYVIPPMPVPNANDLAGASEAAAVRLFCDRAQAARADFALTPALLPVIVEICRRLDGLPLAIELAAARIKLFSPQELLQRLERRLPLLTQGPTGQAPRAQALENAIAWSYGLLSPSERALLNRLAVFVAGFTLPAVEAVCIFPFTEQIFSTGSQAALPMPGAVDGLAALLNQSLLLRQEIGGVIATESRFRMLETIQEFALERLRASSELELVLQRHAEYFAAWAEQAETHLYGPDQAAWLTRMEHDADNLRSALTRLLTAGQIEMAARMARALGVFWRRHGHYSEGRKLLEQVLSPAASTRLPDILRARALQSAGSLAYHQGDWPTAKGWLEESLALFRSCADRSGIARVLFDLGWIAIDQGDWQDAVRLNQGSLALAREVGDPWATYRALTNLGWTQLCTGDQETAAQFFQEAHQLAECVGHTKGVAVSLANLSWIALYQGDILRTVALATESLRLCHLLGEKEVIAECLEILAIAAVEERDVERGARLSGAAQALWDALHVTRSPAQHSAAAHAAAVATMRQQLPEAVLASFWLQGQAMGLDSIAAFVSDRG